MQRRTETVESCEAKLRIDDGVVREGAAAAAVFFRHRGAEKSGLTGLLPHLALVHALVVPALDVRRELGLAEAADLLFEQDEVFGHPGGSRQIESHGSGSPYESRVRFYT